MLIAYRFDPLNIAYLPIEPIIMHAPAYRRLLGEWHNAEERLNLSVRCSDFQ